VLTNAGFLGREAGVVGKLIAALLPIGRKYTDSRTHFGS
jgi:hypothetical protein